MPIFSRVSKYAFAHAFVHFTPGSQSLNRLFHSHKYSTKNGLFPISYLLYALFPDPLHGQPLFFAFIKICLLFFVKYCEKQKFGLKFVTKHLFGLSFPHIVVLRTEFVKIFCISSSVVVVCLCINFVPEFALWICRKNSSFHAFV